MSLRQRHHPWHHGIKKSERDIPRTRNRLNRLTVRRWERDLIRWINKKSSLTRTKTIRENQEKQFPRRTKTIHRPNCLSRMHPLPRRLYPKSRKSGSLDGNDATKS